MKLRVQYKEAEVGSSGGIGNTKAQGDPGFTYLPKG